MRNEKGVSDNGTHFFSFGLPLSTTLLVLCTLCFWCNQNGRLIYFHVQSVASNVDRETSRKLYRQTQQLSSVRLCLPFAQDTSRMCLHLKYHDRMMATEFYPSELLIIKSS